MEKSLSYELLEAEGLFQGSTALSSSWLFPFPSASALGQSRWGLGPTWPWLSPRPFSVKVNIIYSR